MLNMDTIKQTLWCLKSVRAPGIIYKRCLKQSFCYPVDVTEMKRTLFEALNFYKHQKFLFAEATMLQRCIYRMKRKFRSNKGFKALQKAMKCLRLYLDINVAQTVEDLYEVTQEDQKHIQIPDKCNIEFALVRLQTLAKLMERLIEMSKEAALHFNSKIRMGDFWKVAIICFGIVSRLHLISIDILKYTFDFYGYLKNTYDCFNDSGKPDWVPDGYIFPKTLKEWIGIDWCNKELLEQRETEDEPSIFSILNKLENAKEMPLKADDNDDEVVFVSEIINSFAQKNEEMTHEKSEQTSIQLQKSKLKTGNAQKQSKENTEQEEDIGEVVDRSVLDISTNDENKRRKKRKRKNKNSDNKGNKTDRNGFESLVETLNSELHNRISIESSKEHTKRDLHKHRNSDAKHKKINESNRRTYEDFGEIIENPQVYEKHNKEKMKYKSSTTNKEELKDSHLVEGCISLNALSNFSELKKFMAKEKMRRKRNLSACLSKDLDKLQWHMLERSLKLIKNKMNIVPPNNEKRLKKLFLKAKKHLIISLSQNLSND